MHSVIDAVEEDLRDLRIRGRVMGRPKQLYSVYQCSP
jgi:guanosine-3',5'-bis(diphosphate) 3'-pyrophosphohydrolase